MNFKRLLLASVLPFLLSSLPSSAKVSVVARDPYLGAIVLDASNGQVLMAINADETGYPASVLKLMDLLVIQELIEQGKLKLDDRVTVTAEASKVGGSQVYLKEKEVFTIEELLYALMIQSANDGAMALAIHVGGSKEGFLELMNKKAAAIGMKSTHFNSVHGLPPTGPQDPDLTTARDLSLLCLELLKHPDIFKYTSTVERGFRNNTFIMRNHNKLLGAVRGCDGFKTGYFTAAGFSICATAERDGRRVIVVVLGSKDRKVRDAKATELIEKGFLALPEKPKVVAPAPAPAETNIVVGADEEADDQPADAEDGTEKPHNCRRALLLGILIGLGIAGVIGLLRGFFGARRD